MIHSKTLSTTTTSVDLDFFKACSSKLRTKVIYYRSYKKLNESDFSCSLKKANFEFFKNDPNQNHNLLN